MKGRNKILTLLLSVMMVVTMMPSVAFGYEASSVSEGKVTVGNQDDFIQALSDENVSVIKLGDTVNVNTTSYVNITRPLTIDLNSKTLNITTTASYGFYTSGKGGVTIKDTGEAGAINLTMNKSATNYGFYLGGTGENKFLGGILTVSSAKSGGYAVRITGAATEFSGCSILASTYVTYAIYSTKAVNISSGNYTGTLNLTGPTSISGGIFSKEPAFKNLAKGKVAEEITDGNDAGKYQIVDGIIYGEYNGTKYSDLTAFSQAFAGDKIDVSGTTLKLNDDISGIEKTITIYDDVTIDLNGHTFTGAVNSTSSAAIYGLFDVYKAGATLTIQDTAVTKGYISNTSNKYASTITINAGNLEIDGATIKSASISTTSIAVYGIYEYSNNVNGIINLKNSKVKIKEMTAKGTYYGFRGMSVSGTINVDGSTFDIQNDNGAAYGIYTVGKVNVGKNSSTVSTFSTKASGANGSSAIYSTGTEVMVKNANITCETSTGLCVGILAYTSDSKPNVSVGEQVSINIIGAGTSFSAGSFGIRTGFGNMDISGDVNITVNCPNGTYVCGIYAAASNEFSRITGDVTVNVTGKSGETSTIYSVYSAGETVISSGSFTGGDIVGALVSGGNFDRDVSDCIDEGLTVEKRNDNRYYIVDSSGTPVKNVTLDKTYSTLSEALADQDLSDNQEIMLLDNIKTGKKFAIIKNITLNLNGKTLTIPSLTIRGDVTITDNQATNFDNAGTINGLFRVSDGDVNVSKINLKYKGKTNSAITAQYEEESQTPHITFNGVNIDIEYTDSSIGYYIKAILGGSIDFKDTISGFPTTVKGQYSGTSAQAQYLFSAASKSKGLNLDGGTYEITNYLSSAALLYGADSLTYAPSIKDIKAIVKGKTSAVLSQYNFFSSGYKEGGVPAFKLVGGYYAGYTGDELDQLVDENMFFVASKDKKTILNEEGAQEYAEVIDITNEYYDKGYRFTIGKGYAASVGANNYTSLQAAVDAATAGDTIKLLRNVVATQLTIKKDITFDKNGYTLKVMAPSSSMGTAVAIVEPALVLGNGISYPEGVIDSEFGFMVEKDGTEKHYFLATHLVNFCKPYNYSSSKWKADSIKIKLLKDCTFNNFDTDGVDVDLDLNGHKLSGTMYGIDVTGDDDLTIRDTSTGHKGTLIPSVNSNNGNQYTIMSTTTGSLLLKDITIEVPSGYRTNLATDSYNTIVGYSNAKNITLDGVTMNVHGTNSSALNVNGQYKSEIVIKDCSLICDGGPCIYDPQDGTMTITDSIITGYNGLLIKGGTINIGGSKTVITGTGEYNMPTAPQESGGKLTGAAIYVEDSYTDRDITVNITDGIFTAKDSKAPAIHMLFYNRDGNSKINISGGWFSSKINADENHPNDVDYCKEGYVASGAMTEPPAPDKINCYTVANYEVKVEDDEHITSAETNVDLSEKELDGLIKESINSGEGENKIKVIMDIEESEKDTTNQKIEASLKEGQTITDFVEITIEKIIEDNNDKVISKSEVKSLDKFQTLRIVISDTLKNQIISDFDKIFVTRHHKESDGKETITQLPKVSPEVGATAMYECFYIEKIGGVDYVTVRAKNFSVYGLGYQATKISNTYGISITKTGEGTVECDNEAVENIAIIEEGKNAKLEFIPAEDYIINKVAIDGIEQTLPITECEFESISANHTVDIEFVEDIVTATFSANGGKGETSAKDIIRGKELLLPECSFTAPEGQEFAGWIVGTDTTVYQPNESVTLTDNTTITAQWKSISSGNGGFYIATNPTITVDTGATYRLSIGGTKLDITVKAGYELVDVILNGISQGALTTLTGLKTGDKVVITTKRKEENQEEVKTAASTIRIRANSKYVMKNGKRYIKVYGTVLKGKEILETLADKGCTFKYVFYRSTSEKMSTFKKLFTTSKSNYTNTKGTNGKYYYYRIVLRIYDKDGNLVTSTKLSQCKYGSRLYNTRGKIK